MREKFEAVNATLQEKTEMLDKKSRSERSWHVRMAEIEELQKGLQAELDGEVAARLKATGQALHDSNKRIMEIRSNIRVQKDGNADFARRLAEETAKVRRGKRGREEELVTPCLSFCRS